MSHGSDTETGPGWRPTHGRSGASTFATLVIAWNTSEPSRLGEIAVPAGPAAHVLGRGGALADDTRPRVAWYRQRPGVLSPSPPLTSQAISRAQLLVTFDGEAVTVERIGKLPLVVSGQPCERQTLRPGDTARLGHELLLTCVERGDDALRPRGKAPAFEPGLADAAGIVGESPRAFLLRDELAFYATRSEHVLVTGSSGSGKELVARALHRMSQRRDGPFVARNAATIPEGVLDAELFGHAKNFPQAGMSERRGLFGEAEGGVLFLDELGEISAQMQAHLLRVLDAGEYQRLGDNQPRVADVRVVAATNRPLDQLKSDVVARFKLRLSVPPLDERREDIPALARHLVRRICASSSELRERLLDRHGEPRLDPALVEALVLHDYATEVRELESLLLLAVAKSRSDHLALGEDLSARLKLTVERPSAGDARELDKTTIEQALSRAKGSVTQAARELGLRDRNVLYRLMRKLDVTAK